MSFKKIVISAVAAATVATSAFAAVTTNNDGKGEYLNLPAYYATTDGWTTNLRVVNTNTTHAVVAKVVIREYATSKELLDFPIYLSPGDVWTADLVNSGAIDQVKIVSTDDSGPYPGAGLDQALFDKGPLGLDGGNDISHGYVEVLTLGKLAGTTIDSTWAPFSPLSKSLIKAAFEDTANNWDATENDVFAQEVVTSNASGSEKSMTLMATNMDVSMPAVMLWEANPKGAFGVDTTADSLWYAGVEEEIRTFVSKDAVHVVNYVDGVGETQVILTQPYKHTNPDAIMPAAIPYYDNLITSKGYDLGKFYYVARPWDNTEITPEGAEKVFSGGTTGTVQDCETEMCYIYTSEDDNYASGWVNYTLGTDSVGENIHGNIPTIATILTGVRVNGVGIVNLIPAAHTPSVAD
jgi:hypothetical protein